MEGVSPFGRLARRVHGRRRRGLPGVLQRVVAVVLPPPDAPRALLDAPDDGAQLARERARRALLEARHAMSGIIGETPDAPIAGATAAEPAIAPDWDRLRAYLEELERERADLRDRVSSLQTVVGVLRERLDGMERSLPAPAAPLVAGAAPDPIVEAEQQVEANGFAPAADDPSAHASAEGRAAATPPDAPHEHTHETVLPVASAQPPDEGEASLRELRERVIRALRERVFAAGTVGTRVHMVPSPTPEELARFAERLESEPLIEHAEILTAESESSTIRVTLRAPLRWEQYGGLLERALERPIAPSGVTWAHGTLTLRLAEAEPARSDDAESPSETA